MPCWGMRWATPSDLMTALMRTRHGSRYSKSRKIDLALSNVHFGDQTCVSSPVPHRWNAGAGDDVRPSFEKI